MTDLPHRYRRSQGHSVSRTYCTAVGNLDLKAHASTRSGSGETLTTNGLANGFHDLGTGYTSILKLTSDNSGYTSDTVEISAKLNAAVGSATVLTIKMVSTDPAADTLTPLVTQPV